MIPTREEALALLKTYNKEPFHIRHALTVEGVMRYFAGQRGYGDDADFWGVVGLLHDLDFEMWPEEHFCGSTGSMNASYTPSPATGMR